MCVTIAGGEANSLTVCVLPLQEEQANSLTVCVTIAGGAGKQSDCVCYHCKQSDCVCVTIAGGAGKHREEKEVARGVCSQKSKK